MYHEVRNDTYILNLRKYVYFYSFYLNIYKFYIIFYIYKIIFYYIIIIYYKQSGSPKGQPVREVQYSLF